ncbi:T9SS C-terminal target domain-containing protein [candidate division KSB1 bacterium]|nr:MAG: T9SS C-terminal target domain-containing protein [candidate division KSB1 bacterium]
MKRITIFALLFLCVGFAGGQTVVINEFLASNNSTVTDQDGEYDDWIELYNNSAADVPLLGYYLSDDGDDLTQWTLPDTIISAHSYLIVWADEDEEQSGLHANFKISASGEALYLSNVSAAVIDEVSFGAQTADISYGRYPNGTGNFRALYPTSGGPNNNPGPGNVDSSHTVFGDTLIHTIGLQFYVEHWQDTLAYNYEVLDQEYMPAQLTFDGAVVLDSIGIRYKGHSSYELSRNTPKKPFEFKFDEYRDDQRLRGLKKLNVQNCVSDPSFMRETIAYGIARRYVPAPRTAYADVYVSGVNLGFYVLVEQIDKIFLSTQFSDNSGNLYKAGDDGSTLEYQGTAPASYQDELELKTNEEDNDWSGLISFLDRLNNTPLSTFVDSLSPHFNLDGALRLLAFNMVLSNFDSYTGSSRNFYLYDDPWSRRFNLMVWDLNESFGVYPNGWNVITQDALDISNLSRRPLNRRLLENDSLRGVYLNYIGEMIAGPASFDSIAEKIGMLQPLIADHIFADTNKLYSDQNFLNNVEQDVYVDIGRRIPGLKSFARARNANLALQLSEERVYPGDTDNSGGVDEFDVLPIGVYFMSVGAARDSITCVWGARRAVLWDNPAATYADADGDGIVTERDVVAIGVNWNNQHSNVNRSYVLNLADRHVLNEYSRNFRILYNSLSGESEAVIAIRTLLETILDIDPATPASFSVSQNYPNPFNQETVIRFALPERQTVHLTLINVLGQVVSQPINGQAYESGTHEIQVNAAGLSSGVYFYRLETKRYSMLRKMVILR